MRRRRQRRPRDRRGHAYTVGGAMTHLERHRWRELFILGGSLLLAGCASTRDKSSSLAPPGLGGESPSYFGSGEGIGGGRAARRPAFTSLTKSSDSDKDDVIALA